MGVVSRLEDYVNLDENIIDYDEASDFAKFCNGHCADIMDLIGCVKEIKSCIKELDEDDFGTYDEYNLVRVHYEKIYDIIKKVLD